MSRKKNRHHKKPGILSAIRGYFFKGLPLVLSFTLTIYVSWLLFGFLYGLVDFVRPFVPEAWKKIFGLEFLVQTVVIILFLLSIWITGALVKTMLGQYVKRSLRRLIRRIPLAGSLYKGFKQVFKMLYQTADGPAFSRVVLVEFPERGVWAMGFLTGRASENLVKDGREWVKVYVSGAPNPTNGFLIIAPRDELLFPDMSVEQAMKLIVSGGVIKE